MAGTQATRDWRRIARGRDPLYSIASVPGKKGRWTEEDFYAHGRQSWEQFRRHWDQYAPDRGGTCLEIGCGGGRLTAALAPDFERVIAVDVSEDMLARTGRVVPDNVELLQTDGRTLPVADASVDAVFSVHVMQHLESQAEVANYVREARRVLRPGGTAFIHIMVKGRREGPRTQLRKALQVQRSRLALRFGREHTTMLTRHYWLNDVYQMFADTGFTNIELRLIHAGAYAHPCWLATAPA